MLKSIGNNVNKILKNTLTEKQLNEMNKMDNILSKYINSLGYEQRSGAWFKNKNGFTLFQYCNKTEKYRCKSKWFLKVNLQNDPAKIYFSKKCNHVNF